MGKKAFLDKKKDWFKLKRYPHIGFPLKAKDRTIWINDYVTNDEIISKHSFLPFIHNKKKVRKFRKEYCERTGKLLFESVDKKKEIKRRSETKDRELFYAGHLDALIYSYYAEILTNKYEDILTEKKLEEVVTAYRKIAISPDSQKNKCSLDFSTDIFKIIHEFKDDDFVVLAFDIKGFFDNLNHKLLREKWKLLLEKTNEQLPPDHFNVYKNITRFSYIDVVDIFSEFQDKIFVNSFINHKPTITRKRISKLKYLKKSSSLAFCTKEEFLSVKSKLIKKIRYVKEKDGEVVTKNYGIPQGSPISAVLANIYMIDFDSNINKYLLSIGGVYRRYSDDMVVICPLNKKKEVINKFESEIKDIELTIQSKKTQIFHFNRRNNILSCGQEFPNGINYNKNFIYLGLEYDGSYVKIKSASISSYYRKMKRTVQRAKHFTNKPTSKYSGELFKSRLLKRFTHIGSNRRRLYKWDPKKKFFEITDNFDWGNFISYAKKAEKIKLPNKIKLQTRRHWNILEKILK